jgi:hypothetical protein
MDIWQETPLGSYRSWTSPFNSWARPRSIKRDPKPLRPGRATGSPSLSFHSSRIWPPSADCSKCHVMLTRPAFEDSAPCFPAFVASSWNTIARDNAAFGCKRSRPWQSGWYRRRSPDARMRNSQRCFSTPHQVPGRARLLRHSPSPPSPHFFALDEVVPCRSRMASSLLACSCDSR